MIHTVLREASTSGQSFSGNFLPSLLYSAHTSVVRMKPGGTGRPMLLICPRHENQELRPMFPAFSSMEEEGMACAGGQRGMGGRGGVCARCGGRGQTSARLAPLPPRRGFMCLPPSDPCRNKTIKHQRCLGMPQTMCMPGAECEGRRGMEPHRRR